MKIVAPDFYPDFQCRMGACRHTCCAHWEIDVDAETLVRYRAVEGPFGARLKSGIDAASGSIRLENGERCPFLNDGGLCEIILHLGKGALCQVCADHPRYRSFFSDRTEVGLGLCCEAAAALTLRHVGPWRMIAVGEDGQPPPGGRGGGAADRAARRAVHVDRLRQRAGVALGGRAGRALRRCIAAKPVRLGGVPPDPRAPRRAMDGLPDPSARRAAAGRARPRVGGAAAAAALSGDALPPPAPGAGGRRRGGWVVWVGAMWRVVRAVARQTGDLLEAARLWSAEIEYSAENVEAVKRECEKE